jgi:hypothetical protein
MYSFTKKFSDYIFFKKEERKMKKIPSAASGAKYRASNEN